VHSQLPAKRLPIISPVKRLLPLINILASGIIIIAAQAVHSVVFAERQVAKPVFSVRPLSILLIVDIGFIELPGSEGRLALRIDGE
jgi:hypothetical protein